MQKNETPLPDNLDQEIADLEQSETKKLNEFMARGRAAIKESRRVREEKRREAVKALSSKTGIDAEVLNALT